jgi:hypothetical protein
VLRDVSGLVELLDNPIPGVLVDDSLHVSMRGAGGRGEASGGADGVLELEPE